MKERIRQVIFMCVYLMTILLGVLFIILWDQSLILLQEAFLIAIGAIIIMHIVFRLMIQQKTNLVSFLQLLSYILLFFFGILYLNPQTTTIMFSIFGGLWLFLDGVVKLIYSVQQFRHNRVQSILYTFFSVVTFLFAYVLLRLNIQAIYFGRLFLGTYLIVFGLFHLLDSIVGTFYFTRFLSRIKLFEMIPRTLFSIQTPRMFRLQYDRLKKEEKAKFTHTYTIDKDVDIVTPMFIYVHMKYPTRDMLGHIDFAIDGVNYAFGNYDETTYTLGNNKSDGVLIVSDDAPYLRLSVYGFRKIIAAFTLNITIEQKKLLQDAIESIIADEGVLWDPKTLARKTSYSKSLKEHIGSHFYKFKSTSEHATYITATNNCVHFFDRILSEAQIKIFPNQTISTPGDVFHVLNTYAEDPNDTLVVKRTLLTKEKCD